MLFSMIVGCRLQFKLRKFMWRFSTYIIYWTIGEMLLALLVMSHLMSFLLVEHNLVELLGVNHVVVPLLYCDMCLSMSLLRTHLSTIHSLHPILNTHILERLLLLILRAGGMFNRKSFPRLWDGKISKNPHSNQLVRLICVPMPSKETTMMDGICFLLRVVVRNTCNLLITFARRLLMINEVFYYVGH